MIKNCLYILFYCLGFSLFILFFNSICNIYNMTTLHRVLCILSISFSQIFNSSLFGLFDREIFTKNREGS